MKDLQIIEGRSWLYRHKNYYLILAAMLYTYANAIVNAMQNRSLER